MLIKGDKVLVSHRRMFKDDAPRFFIGEVLAYDAGIVKLKGFSFSWDYTGGTFVKKNEPRVKIVSLSSGNVFAYQLPHETYIGQTEFVNRRGITMLTDGASLDMDMAEWPAGGGL